MADVTEPVLARDQRRRRAGAGRVGERARHLADTAGASAGDVEGAGRRLGREQRREICERHIAHVDEVTPLCTVLEHPRCLARGQRAGEQRCDTGIRGVARHPRPIDVVVAKGGRRNARLPFESRGEVLLVELRRCVDVARIELCLLGDRLTLELAPALRAARLETSGIEVLGAARRRTDDAMLWTGVATLAVDDHARREHQAPGEAPFGQSTQQHRRAGVVVAHIVGDIEEVGAEADHPGLVADVDHALERALDGRRVADVALDEVRLAREVTRRMGMGEQRVEYPHLEPFGDQGVDDMRADEPGSAGDEYHRGCAAARTRVMSRTARSVPRTVPVTFERPARGA